MLTTVEISSRAIRVCRVENGRLTLLESFPVPAGTDPLQALASAPLPGALGRVRVVMSHGDLLLRTMMQPPSPVERLGKMVRFELQGSGDGEPVATTWHLVKAGGADDMRLLTMTAKQRLIDELKKALAPHGGKLTALTHPAIGLYQAWRGMSVEDSGPGLLVDVGGQNIHVALIQDGELTFIRTQNSGMDELVKQVAEMRSMAEGDASALVAKLGKGAPADLHEAIKRQVGQVAGVLNANIRFAKTQLKLDACEPKVIWLTGAGAQVFGFIEALAERMGVPVKPINPFSRLTPALSNDRLDRHSQLPNAWAVAIGAARAAEVELDVMAEERERRSLFWRTDGALRVAAVLVAALFVLAIVRQEIALGSTAGSVATLEGNGDGLVPKAIAARKKLDEISDTKGLDTSRLAWIDGERRSGRIAVELLGAIAAQEGPETPVFLQSYKLDRRPGQVVVEIEGFAMGSGKRATDGVLHAFEQGLIKRYQPISAIKQLPRPIDSTRQQFHYVLTISDQPLEVLASEPGKDALKLEVAVPVGVDGEGAARVAAMRARSGSEERVVVKVKPVNGGAGQDVTVTFKN